MSYRPLVKVHLWSGLRSLAEGKEAVEVRAATIGQMLDELVVTDTIPLSDAARACDTIRQLGVGELLAETMRRISDAESVSSLYVD